MAEDKLTSSLVLLHAINKDLEKMAEDKLPISREKLDAINKDLEKIIESNLTAERQIENLLLKAGFQSAMALRYNAASIRVRVIDPRFAKLSVAERDALVEPYLAQLPEHIQRDIICLFTFAPDEPISPMLDPDEEEEEMEREEREENDRIMYFSPEHDPDKINERIDGVSDELSELKVKYYDLKIKLDAYTQLLSAFRTIWFINTVIFVIVAMLLMWVLKTHTH